MNKKPKKIFKLNINTSDIKPYLELNNKNKNKLNRLNINVLSSEIRFK